MGFHPIYFEVCTHAAWASLAAHMVWSLCYISPSLATLHTFSYQMNAKAMSRDKNSSMILITKWVNAQKLYFCWIATTVNGVPMYQTVATCRKHRPSAGIKPQNLRAQASTNGTNR